MDKDKMTKSTKTKIEPEATTETKETGLTSPDFIPFHVCPRPKHYDKKSNQENDGLEKNGQKRLKVEKEDGGSKKARISTAASNINEGGVNKTLYSSDTEEYYLTISNLPTNWSYVQIKNYLDKECGHVDEMEMLQRKNLKPSAIRLTFQSPQECIAVYRKLENKVVQNRTLEAKISDTYTTYPTGVTVPSSILDEYDVKESKATKPVSKHWRPDEDVWEIDPEGLYGLRPEFLTYLNLKPPLNKLLHVTNFRCDKNELKEVMEIAGNVLMCSVVTSSQRYAKVMYSHPLEAVQAISMLNGQMFYGVPLRITMDKNLSDCVVLPRGLANIGLGLGLEGRPIRNMAHQYQRFAKNQSSIINPIVFSKIGGSNIDKTEEDPKEVKNKIKEFMNTVPKYNIINSIGLSKTKNNDASDAHDSNSKDGNNISSSETKVTKINLGGSTKTSSASPSPNQDCMKKTRCRKPRCRSPLLASPATGGAPNPHVRGGNSQKKLPNPPVPMHNPLPPPPREPYFGPGNNHIPEGPPPFLPPAGPFMPMPRPPFGPPPMPPVPFIPGPIMRPPIPPGFNGNRPNLGNPPTVKFSNLPPSTSFPLLCDQLAQCGQVMSIQLTTPGCAVATFGHPSHADRCIQTFNGMNVEGYTIEVGFT